MSSDHGMLSWQSLPLLLQRGYVVPFASSFRAVKTFSKKDRLTCELGILPTNLTKLFAEQNRSRLTPQFLDQI